MASSGRGKATTWQQRSIILEWLEIPSNFRLITGGTQPGPVIAGKKLKKSDAYNQLAAFVNEKLGYSDPSEKWDQKIAKIRYESLVKTYKTTRDKYQDPGGKKFALTDVEISKGKTIDTKLNEMCPYYHRWDSLFGGRQNVNPAHTFEGGIAGSEDDATYSMDYDNVGECSDDDTLDDREPEELIHLTIAGEEEETNEDVDRIVPVSSDSAEPQVSRPTTTVSRKSTAPIPLTINPVLRQLSATVAAETPSGGKLTDKRKGDFGATYSTMKSKELDLISKDKNRELEIAAQRLELDRKIAADELEFKRLNMQEEREFKRQTMIEEREDRKQSVKDAMRKDLMLALVHQGKSAAEIREYWAMLGDE